MYKIAIVDDSPLIHKIVSRALEDRYELISFTSGVEAAEKIGEVKPDLVLLDVEMPETDGFETIKLLKKAKCMKDTPVIFLTARNDVDFELQAFDLGAVDYINKPFSNPLLVKRVEIHLKQAIDKRNLSEDNQEKTKTIQDLQSAIVYTLADLVEMRDNSTGGHVFRTQRYFELILDYLAENNIYQDILKGMDRRLLLEASQLHDVGKVAIPDAILLKPARLTPEEFEIMKTHTTIGYNAIHRAMDLTSDKEFLEFASLVALSHHERWDGNGYPNKLSGTEIPIAGRIMAIVDVYDALVSERHYKKALSHEESMRILLDGRGAHFDPTLIDACNAINEKFKQISHEHPDTEYIGEDR